MPCSRLHITQKFSGKPHCRGLLLPVRLALTLQALPAGSVLGSSNLKQRCLKTVPIYFRQSVMSHWLLFQQSWILEGFCYHNLAFLPLSIISNFFPLLQLLLSHTQFRCAQISCPVSSAFLLNNFVQWFLVANSSSLYALLFTELFSSYHQAEANYCQSSFYSESNILVSSPQQDLNCLVRNSK